MSTGLPPGFRDAQRTAAAVALLMSRGDRAGVKVILTDPPRGLTVALGELAWRMAEQAGDADALLEDWIETATMHELNDGGAP